MQLHRCWKCISFCASSWRLFEDDLIFLVRVIGVFLYSMVNFSGGFCWWSHRKSVFTWIALLFKQRLLSFNLSPCKGLCFMAFSSSVLLECAGWVRLLMECRPAGNKVRMCWDYSRQVRALWWKYMLCVQFSRGRLLSSVDRKYISIKMAFCFILEYWLRMTFSVLIQDLKLVI